MYSAGTLNSDRSSQRCPECQKIAKDFGSNSDFHWHVETCVRYAFESEVLNAFNDFRVIPSATRTQIAEPVPGVVAKAGPRPIQQTVIRVDFGNSMKKAGSLPNPRNHEQSTSKSRKSSTLYHSDFGETIRGPGGLQLMVTVEQPRPLDGSEKTLIERDVNGLTKAERGIQDSREEQRQDGTSDDEQDPTVDSPPDMDYGGHLSEGPLENEVEEQFEGNDDPEIDFSSITGLYPSSSYPKVIGALANADDDMRRLKMECPACGLRLYRHNYSTHYRVHTGELPFPCHYCDKRFRTTSGRRVHERAHTGEKPYVCPSCNYAAMTKRNLDRHVYNNHIRDGQRRGPRNRRSKYRDLPPPELIYHSIEKEVVIEDEDEDEEEDEGEVEPEPRGPTTTWTHPQDHKIMKPRISNQSQPRDDHAYGRL